MEDQKQLRDLESQVTSLPAKAEFITVHSQPTLDRANEFLNNITTIEKKIDALFDENIKRLDKAHKEELKLKRFFLEPCEIAKVPVKKEILRYLNEQEEIRLKAEREKREVEEKKFEEARKAERLGFEKAAERIREEDTKVGMPMPDKVVSKGSHLRKHWTWEIVDRAKIPQDFLIVDELKVNATVRTLKGKTSIPGIRVFQESTLAKR